MAHGFLPWSAMRQRYGRICLPSRANLAQFAWANRWSSGRRLSTGCAATVQDGHPHLGNDLPLITLVVVVSAPLIGSLPIVPGLR
jgi:hypothetical protein